MITWARHETPLIGAVATAAFVDYFTSMPGERGEREDWDATWRTWMRNEQTKRENAPGFRGTRVQTAVDAVPTPRPGADEQCRKHRGQPKATCGPCRGEAIADTTTAADTVPGPRQAPVAMCPEHPDLPAAFCRPCRVERRTATAPDDRTPR